MDKTLGIFAPGLLGASLGMAAHAHGLFARVLVWARREQARSECEAAPWCDAASTDLAEIARQSDFIVLCPPVDAIPALFSRLADHLREGAVVTDVGSTKEQICNTIAAGPRGEAFIGSHPMAGSEKSGMAAARADLFAGAPCVVTPLPAHDPQRLRAVQDFWRALGGMVQTVSPAEHDEIVAAVSHLPHIAAAALARVALGTHGRQPFCGSGLRDTTRIAAGDPALWVEIIRQNRPHILRQMQLLQAELADWQNLLASDDAEAWRERLTAARTLRQTLSSVASGRSQTTP